jgi:hypothetical protein
MKEALNHVELILTRAKEHPAFNEQCFEEMDIAALCEIGGDECDWTLTAIDAKIIRARLSEVQKPSHKSVSREMPGVKAFESAYDAHSIKETGHRATEDELDIVRFCHNFIARHFGQ